MPRSGKGARLLERFTKPKQEFKPFKFDLATDLQERLETLKKETGMTAESVNNALNYAVRTLVTRLEREVKHAAGTKQAAGAK